MNAHIEKLKLQAGIENNPDQQGLDLFAELLIQECAKIADCRSSFKHNTGSKILKHFDMKETV